MSTENKEKVLEGSSEEPLKCISERTLLIVKPDGVARGLIGEVLGRFEKKGFNMVASKLVKATNIQLLSHYAEHAGRDYFSGIIDSMTLGPVFVFVMEGPVGTVDCCRKMLGKTDPLKADPGTIRGDLCISTGRNVCHASDSVDSANREIQIWFEDNELVDYTPAGSALLYRE